MTNEERAAYSRGLSDAYNVVFRAFATAFEDGQDIHWLRAHIEAKWDDAKIVLALL